MSRALRLVMIASMVLLGALSASLFMAFRQRPYPGLRQLRSILFDNWGLYSLFQFQVSLLLAAAWILCVHRRKGVALLWVAALALGGHIVTIVFIMRRARSARSLAEVFTPQARPPEAVESHEPIADAPRMSFDLELPAPDGRDPQVTALSEPRP